VFQPFILVIRSDHESYACNVILSPLPSASCSLEQ
jgi:hypothetical protein